MSSFPFLAVRYPHIEVQLTGKPANAFYILGAVANGLRRNEVSEAEVTEFGSEATSGDFDDLLVTAMRWVTVL